MGQVSDILATKGSTVLEIDCESTVFDAVSKMVDGNVGSLLVTEDGRLVGIVTERDYLRRVAIVGRDERTTPVREIMSAPIVYTTPVSRADGADVVLLPTDLSVATGVPSLTNCVEGTPEAGFPDEIAPRPEDYVVLKRRPSAFYGTGVAEILRLLRRTALVIGGGATNRGVETSVREAFSMDLDTVVVRECCWGGDAAAHAYSLDTSMKMYARIRTLDQTLAMLG